MTGPKSLSERWERNRWDWENILRSQETVHTEAATVSISLDGIKIPMADGDRAKKRAQALERGKQPRGPNGYREAACATFSVYDEEGNRLETIFHGWAMIGGQGVLTLRSLLQSARWDRGWDLLSRSYQPKIRMIKRLGHLELIEDLDKAA